MKKTIYIFLLGCLLSSCVKWVDPDTTGKRIADKVVPAACSFVTVPIQPGSETIWKATPVDKWLDVNIKGYVKGEYAVTIKCASNESTPGRRNFARVGRVLVETYDHTKCDTIVVKQSGLVPEITLADTQAAPSSQECLIPLATNLTDEQRPSLSFSADKSWVKSMKISSDNAHVAVALDGAGSGEQSQITMRFTPAWGDPVEASCTLTIKQ